MSREDTDWVGEVLRGAPELTLPDADLERVWDRTIRAAAPGAAAAGPEATRGKVVPIRRWVPGRAAAVRWSALAAAVVAAVAFLTLDHSTAPVPRRGLDPELLRAAAELRAVMRLADETVRGESGAAMASVLQREVAPALRRAEPARLQDEATP